LKKTDAEKSLIQADVEKENLTWTDAEKEV
jgi:hypothetical protein